MELRWVAFFVMPMTVRQPRWSRSSRSFAPEVPRNSPGTLGCVVLEVRRGLLDRPGMITALPRLSLFVAAFLGGAAVCYAETTDYLNRQLKALDVIKSTITSICYTIEQRGQTLSSDAKAQLSEAVSTVNSLNLSQERIEYSGVEQQALASALSGSQSCKMTVFNTLVVLMVPSIQATGLPIEKSVHLNPRKPSHVPSIDCTRTNEPLEDLLCADDDLAIWDGRMGQIYHQKRDILDPARSEMLRKDQIAWIRLRDRTCNYHKQENYSVDQLAPAKPCVLQMTKERVPALSQW
jgi:uncharacterized protein YecT (DUF1311 family)